MGIDPFNEFNFQLTAASGKVTKRIFESLSFLHGSFENYKVKLNVFVFSFMHYTIMQSTQ